MKRWKRWLFLIGLPLFVLLLPSLLLLHSMQQEQRNDDLISAIQADNTPTALALLKQGADPSTREHFYDEPLSFREQLDRFLTNLFHRNAQTQQDQHITALGLAAACRQDNPTLVKALLDAGANPNATFFSNVALEGEWTPLMFAIERDNYASLRLLLERGADVNFRYERRRTPLLNAIVRGHLGAVSLLLESGADPNIKDAGGMTPLHHSLRELSIIAMLLKYHADVNVRDVNGRTPLDYDTGLKDFGCGWMLRQAGGKTGKELDALSKH